MLYTRRLCQLLALRWQTIPESGTVRVTWPILNDGANKKIRGMTKARVVRFHTQVSYMKLLASWWQTTHNWRGQDHVTHLKIVAQSYLCNSDTLMTLLCSAWLRDYRKRDVFRSCDVSKFWEITDIILETGQRHRPSYTKENMWPVKGIDGSDFGWL